MGLRAAPAGTTTGHAQLLLPGVLLALAMECVAQARESELRLDHVAVVQKFIVRATDESKLPTFALGRSTDRAVEWAQAALREDGADTPEEHLAAVAVMLTQVAGTEFDRPEWADLVLVGASIALEATEDGGWGDKARIASAGRRVFDELRRSGALLPP